MNVTSLNFARLWTRQLRSSFSLVTARPPLMEGRWELSLANTMTRHLPLVDNCICATWKKLGLVRYPPNLRFLHHLLCSARTVSHLVPPHPPFVERSILSSFPSSKERDSFASPSHCFVFTAEFYNSVPVAHCANLTLPPANDLDVRIHQ